MINKNQVQEKTGNLRLSSKLSRLSYSTVDRWDVISNDGGMSKSSSLVLSAIGMESSSAQ